MMNANEAIRLSLDTADMIMQAYLGDLTDEEMMHRPSEKSNHIKWQLGHLIGADNQMVGGCCEGALAPLPEGFSEKYTKETSTVDDAAAFDSKEELLSIFNRQRGAIQSVLEELSDDDLTQPSPEAMQAYAPTVASVFSMLGIHLTMHTGQWAVVRRQLGREPLF